MPFAAVEASESLYPIPLITHGAESMESRSHAQPDSLASQPLLVIRGSGARLEGSFEIEESIEIECEVRGDLNVGGTLVIGESGRVSADVITVNAVILGTYTGSMKASGSIEIASTGRVNGTLASNELVIAKGGVFTGSVSRTDEAQEADATAKADAGAPARKPQAAVPERPAVPRRPAPFADVSRASTPTRADGNGGELERNAAKDRTRTQEVPLA
jgi:cytoskeletal protein CcmA (bactofilin family)